MDIQIKYGYKLSVEEFNAILDLDRAIFGNDILTNEGMALKRFLKSRASIISTYSGDTLMGFIGFFNVIPAVYKRTVFKQEYIDDNLCDSEIRPLIKGKGNKILMFDLAVNESFRHQGVSKKLHNLTWDYLRKKHNDGYSIDHIFGYAITPEGFRSMLSYGGRELWTRENITLLKINKKDLAAVTDVLTTAFKNDLLYQAVFQNEKELRRYLKLMLDYFNNNGEIHTAVVDDKIVGVSIWNFKGTPFFNIRNALKSGMIGEIFNFLMITQIKSLIKLKKEGLITERYH